MEKVDVVIPLYNSINILEPLLKNIHNQKNIIINKIVCSLTIGNDDIVKKEKNILEKYNVDYFELDKNSFSHSLTREKAIIEKCSSKYVIMLSQDVELINDDAFINIINYMKNNGLVYCYGKQVSKYNNIEKYIREINYPKESSIVSFEEKMDKKITYLFSSDAFAIYDREIFLKENGYDGKNMMMNEDMYYSHKILTRGYKKGYCASSIVYHSHNYTLKELYRRYYETGRFFKNFDEFNEYNFNNSGFNLAIKVLKKALLNFNIPVLIRWLPDMSARYFGMRKGRK
ncbi:MAG: glycosyltransferase family 2 protein [Bacilli bacterium]|nr:glycosyltransferase family 2 protein [Bacilli bacterium]